MSRAGEGAGAGWLLTKLLQRLKVQPRAQNQPVLVFGVPKPEGLGGWTCSPAQADFQPWEEAREMAQGSPHSPGLWGA